MTAAPARLGPGLRRHGLGDAPWVALAVVVAATSVVLSADEEGPVLCLWRRCTGAYCPGCGATRAARALLSGDVVASWRLHPMVVVVAAQVALFGALRVAWPRLVGRTAGRALVLVVSLDVAALLVLWLYRLATGAIPGFGAG